jgi:hypothetical protein
MKADREAFRRVNDDDNAPAAFIAVVAATGFEGEALLARMKKALHGLEDEGAR